MGLPIGTALAGIGVGTMIVGILSNFLSMPDFTTTLAIMIGLGVGIDYALFIVTRYREGVHRGLSSEDATAIAINTAGRAVLFAGTTVVISLLGMLLMGLAFVNGLGIGAATVVAVTMVASVTLLPALLGFAQDRIEVTRWRGIIAAGLVAVALVGLGLNISPLLIGLPLAVIVLLAGFAFAPLRREVPRRTPPPVERTLAYRWSRFIQRNPWPSALGGWSSSSCWRCRSSASAWAFRTRATTPRTPPPARRTTCSPTASDRATTARSSSPPRSGRNRPGSAAGDHRRRRRDPGVANVTPADPRRPRQPDGCDLAGDPDDRAQDSETTALVNTLRDDVLPRPSTGADSTSPSPETSPSRSTSPTTCRHASRCSSASCWPSRSCS